MNSVHEGVLSIIMRIKWQENLKTKFKQKISYDFKVQRKNLKFAEGVLGQFRVTSIRIYANMQVLNRVSFKYPSLLACYMRLFHSSRLQYDTNSCEDQPFVIWNWSAYWKSSKVRAHIHISSRDIKHSKINYGEPDFVDLDYIKHTDYKSLQIFNFR